MTSGAVRFGDDLELDRVAYELRRSGRALKLERIPMEILLLLIERHGQLISRDEIIGRIWGKDVFLDTDNSINSAIRKIRHVLKDDPEDPVFIQTVTGKGYRFIAAVIEVGIQDANQGAAGNSVAPDQAIEAGKVTLPAPVRSFWRLRWMVPLAAVAVLLAAGMYVLRVRERAHSASRPHRVMLAVLPFQNLSNDAAQEYFSDGLTEETITDLGEVSPEQLSVIARTSAMAYKHTGKTVTEIGRELGADYILEGSVRREGDTARVSAQLIRVQDQSHLWAHNYDREVGGLVTLENELGAAIAQQVQVVLTPHGSRFLNRHATNAKSYELYLQGLSYLSQRTAEALKKSVDYFQLSTEKDPGFAPAYAGLAAAYNSEAVWSQQEFEPRAKVAAIRALDLDDGLAEAHAELGSEEALFEYDWPGAEREFKRALELNPNSADAHFLYSWNYLTEVGHTDEAIAEMKKALELDPLSPMYNTILGYIYYCARQYDHASQQDDKAIGLAPDFFIAHYQRATLLSQLGQYPDAITELTKSRLLAKDSRTKLAATADVSLRRAFAADGARGFWREIQREDEEGDAYHNLGAFDLPQAYAHLGEKENALKSLEEYYEKRNALMSLLKVDPAFDALRSDPRFVSLLRRMGLDR